jgi:ATPase subunit of ABC transporter with duplicated ATPase domains
MDSIVELTTLGAARYGGNWSHYRERKALELAAARHDLFEAEKRLSQVAEQAQASAERQSRRRRAGERKRARGDAPKVLLNKMRNDSENTGGAQHRLAERQRVQAIGQAAAARQRIEVLQPFSVVLPRTGLPAGRTILRIEDASVGFVPGRPILRDLSLAIGGPERVAVVGPNGSGKTTLLALIAGRLRPWSGTVRVVDDFALLDQQVSLLEAEASLRDNFLRLNRRADENACRAALARFMFRADAALETVASLSGGQVLRAGLACVLGVKPPSLLMLDEPTNHLDVDAIEAVEAGLRAYDGALVVVSHDEAFLRAVGVSRRLELPTLATA